MKPDYDAIVLGGDLNGLLAAKALAEAGRRVLLIEPRPRLGGIASTEELLPGFRFNIGLPDSALMDYKFIRDLGAGLIENPAVATALQAGGPPLTLWRDPVRSQADIALHSTRDAEALPAYAAQAEQFAALLGRMARLAPPSLKYAPPALLLRWAGVAWAARRLGGSRMMEFLRLLPMSAYHYLNGHFESERLRGLLAVPSVDALMQGPRAAGTAFKLLYGQLGGHSGGYRSGYQAKGGTGVLVDKLAAAAEAAGVEIRMGAKLLSLEINDYRVVGVESESGEMITAKAVLSSLDPRSTFFDLVGAPNLEPRVVRRLRNMKYQGSTATVHLALGRAPDFGIETERLTGDIVLCPSLDYAEQAYDEAKYSRLSKHPILIARLPSLLDPGLAPEGQQAMSVTLRYAPYHLAQGDWDSRRQELVDLVVNTLEPYATGGLGVLNARAITPLDYERDYGLPAASFTQGQMGLDQLLLMRPIPGFNGYRSPLDGLYLCGDSAHPGGGLSGWPGLNAAWQVLKEID